MISVVAIALTLVLQAPAPPPPGPAVFADFEARLLKEPNTLRLGADYRQAIITGKQFDRAIKFFRDLVRRNRRRKTPASTTRSPTSTRSRTRAGSRSRFSAATRSTPSARRLQLGPNWLALYVRGWSICITSRSCG
jgi:hypothetical protein